MLHHFFFFFKSFFFTSFFLQIPICIDAVMVHREWNEIKSQIKLIGEMKDRDQIQFCKQFSLQNEQYKKMNAELNNLKHEHYGVIGDWNRADSIHQIGLDGLHASLRIAGHVLKYFILMTLNHYLSKDKNTDNVDTNYKSLTRNEVIRHFVKCCKIPFYYNSDNPSMSKIDTDGNKKRTFWKNLGKLIVCDECSYRPYYKSGIESYLAMMLIHMTETLIPFEILSYKTYGEYFDNHIKPESNKKYKTSNWKISAIYFYVIFLLIFGARRSTRYIHTVCNNSYYFFKLCKNMYSTPRALFGADAGEMCNHKIKNLIYTITNKFQAQNNRKNIPSETLDSLLRFCIWEQFLVRESNVLLNTGVKQQKLLRKQNIYDRRNMRLPHLLHEYFKTKNVECNIDSMNLYTAPYSQNDEKHGENEENEEDEEDEEDEDDGIFTSYFCIFTSYFCIFTSYFCIFR